MLYRVLIVDDEKIVRIALKSMLDWEQEGFALCAVAGSADEALLLIEKHRPHLVITDIEMPVKNGLELMTQARASGYMGEFLVLTNHQRFSYAINALQNSALDYLIKTDLNRDRLREALRAARQKIIARHPLDETDAGALAADTDAESVRTCLRAGPSGGLFTTRYCFLYIFLRSRLSGETLHIQPDTLKNIVSETSGVGAQPVFTLSCDRCIIMLPAEDAERQAQQLTASITRLVRLYMNMECSFLLTAPVGSHEALTHELALCRSAEFLSVYFGFQTLFHAAKIRDYTAEPPAFRTTFLVLKSAIAASDYAAAEAHFHQYLLICRDSGVDPARTAQNSVDLQNLILIDNSIWIENTPPTHPAERQPYRTPVTLAEHERAMHHVLQLVQKSRPNFLSGSYRPEIRQICGFVQENVCSHITLNTLSQSINMTPNYISRLFKLETGLNIVQYINYMKLERAKDMLANTADSIKLVSLHLGFDEPSYFNKLFNKTYGMNPTEYRKLLQQYGYTSSAPAEAPRNPG